jgi:hypothetical protein
MSKRANKLNKQEEVSADQALIAGVEKHLATTTLTLGGTPYTATALVSLIQGRITAVTATIASQATWKAAVKAEAEAKLESDAAVGGLRKTIYAMFTDVAQLADFGLAPHKKPVLTPAERVAMVAKAKATRAARHTMGSKQKAGITGSSPGAGSSPVAPAAPAPSPEAPASPPAGSGTTPAHS